MRGCITLLALLTVLLNGAYGQPPAPLDRAAELMGLQLKSRSTQPPPGSMDGARATAIYKRFSEPAAHGGQVQGAAAATTGPGQQ